MRRRIVAAIMAAALAFALPAGAQDSMGGSAVKAAREWRKPEDSAAFAKQIERDIAAKGARVAIVFRTGRQRKDLPEGIAYTHGAFWIYGDIEGSDGKTYKGYSVYNLYQGDGDRLPVDRSVLRQDFPVDFIVGAATDDVAVIIPSPEMQRRLIETVDSPVYERMHVPSYTLVSNPFDATHQNCTEFVLDVVSAAAWRTDNYAQVKANLKAHFQPTIVHANLFQVIFGPMVDPRLNLDDQDGDIRTATYESIAAFMTANGLLKETYVILKDGAMSSPRPAPVEDQVVPHAN